MCRTAKPDTPLRAETCIHVHRLPLTIEESWIMKNLLLAALATGAMLTLAAPASARDGCGPRFHSRPNGRCVPNRGPAYRPGYRPGPTLIIGNYYHGRGYWDGRRYWHNRYRYRNGWRYR
jgi:hypothetical protein